VGLTAGSVTKWDNATCGAPRGCTLAVPGAPGGTVAIETFATLQQAPGSTAWTLASTWCPTKATPLPDTQALREQAARLLPSVPVGWIGPHLSLVNVQEILWVPSAAVRNLGTVTVVGQGVQLRTSFDHATWTFGDGATDSTDSLGRPYDQSRPCATKQCPGFYGHTYTERGPETIALTVSWVGQYSLDTGTTWTTIAGGTITGPSTTVAITVKQARAELISPQH
jgi:hypothetical protein